MSNRTKMNCGCVIIKGSADPKDCLLHGPAYYPARPPRFLGEDLDRYTERLRSQRQRSIGYHKYCRDKQEPIKKDEYYPEMPPALPGEIKYCGVYLNLVTGNDETERVLYDHFRLKNCSMGIHMDCTDPRGNVCTCPCHTIHKRVVEALDFCVSLVDDIACGRKRITKPVMLWREVKRILAAAQASL